MWRILACAIAVGLGGAGCGRLQFDPSGGDDEPPAGPPWSAISVSDTSSCGIRQGELWCWGQGLGGLLGIGTAPAVAVPTRVGTAADWTAIDVSPTHACGLRGDGEAYCWGSNVHAALGPVPPPDAIVLDPTPVPGRAWTAIDAGFQSTCGIERGGALWCWGRNKEGQLGIGNTVENGEAARVGTATWTALAVGDTTVCGIQTDGSLWCWGQNDAGSVGDGTSQQNRTSPVHIAPGRAWRAVATGEHHSCAIDDAGQGWCWGNNRDGRLGTGTQDESLAPARIAAGSIAALSVGRNHTCANIDGKLACWGASIRGAVPGVTALAVTVPSQIDQPVRAIAAGGGTTCVLDGDDQLRCAGANGFGQAGQLAGEVHALERADDRSDWTKLYADANHACGETADGMLRCWGAGEDGQLGDDARLDRQLPVEVGTGFTGVAISDTTTAALRGPELWGWGVDIPSRAQFPKPTTLGDMATDIAIGYRHGCALDANGDLRCGGRNHRGQLGDGTTTNADEVTVPGPWRSVLAAGDLSCATAIAGPVQDALFCWGAGELAGSTATGDVLAPARVDLPPADVLHAALGEDFACALLEPDGAMHCWGDNASGQLGLPDVPYTQTPLAATARTGWIALDAGASHACAIAGDHTLWCWGRGDQGQLGEPLRYHNEPRQLGTDTDWDAVALGRGFTCALKRDGTRWCTGANDHGELGNGRSWLPALARVP